MIYIGIDPGKKGAWAEIREDVVCVFPWNIWDEADFIKGMMMYSLWGPYKDDVGGCVLEHVGAMPGQGVTSMFHFGENFGFIQGVLRAYSIPYELVRPKRWQMDFGVTGDKNTSIEVAHRLFPGIDLRRTPRCKKESDGMSDALLMAEWARRHMK